MSTGTCNTPDDYHDPIELRIVAILVVVGSLFASLFLLCFKVKLSWSKLKTERPYALKFSSAVFLLFNSLTFLIQLVFDRWVYGTSIVCPEIDIADQVFLLVFQISGLCAIICMYMLVYERYKQWDIWADTRSLLKKRILYSIELVIKWGAIITLLFQSFYLIYRCIEDLQTIYFGGYPESQSAVRDILRLLLYITYFPFFALLIFSIYFDYYLVQAALIQQSRSHSSNASSPQTAAHELYRKFLRLQLYRKLVLISAMDMVQIIIIILRVVSNNIPADVMTSILGIVSAWLVVRIYTLFSFVDQVFHCFIQAGSNQIPLEQLVPTSFEFKSTAISHSAKIASIQGTSLIAIKAINSREKNPASRSVSDIYPYVAGTHTNDEEEEDFIEET